MGPIGIIWAVLIALKIAGVAFVATSWWILLLWPIVPIAIIFVLFLLGVGGLAFWRSR